MPNGFPWMKRDAAAACGAVHDPQAFDGLELGTLSVDGYFVYHRLADYQWVRHDLPSDLPSLRRLVGQLTEARFAEAWREVGPYFDPVGDGRIGLPWITKQTEHVQAISEKRAAAGGAGGRVSKRGPTAGHDKQMLTVNKHLLDGEGKANASQTDKQMLDQKVSREESIESSEIPNGISGDDNAAAVDERPPLLDPYKVVERVLWEISRQLEPERFAGKSTDFGAPNRRTVLKHTTPGKALYVLLQEHGPRAVIEVGVHVGKTIPGGMSWELILDQWSTLSRQAKTGVERVRRTNPEPSTTVVQSTVADTIARRLG